MLQKILLTRPSHDITTQYLSCWAEDIIKVASERGIGILDLKDAKATCKFVSEYLINNKPGLVVFSGHGSPTTIGGHKNEVLIEAGKNESLLRAMIVYAVSCHAAKVLGKSIVRHGGRAFIGYEGRFGFPRNPHWGCDPKKDKLVEPFRIASNAAPLAILKGNSVGESFERAQQAFLSLIRKYAISDAFPENKDIRFWLFWDMYFQRLLGDKDAAL